MRRILTLAATVALIVAGIGCQHIAGVCDCATHPDNAVLPPATNPYPVVGNVVTGVPAAEMAPPPAPATVEKKDEKKDEKKMDKPMPPGK